MEEDDREPEAPSDITFRLFELITEMTDEEQQQLLQELEKKLVHQKRKHERTRTNLTVYYATHDRAYRDIIQNISPSGVFIETREPFLVGQEILLNFTPARNNDPIKVRGKIVRVTPAGVGVKFIRAAVAS
jgi:hypothetical protein